MTGGKENEARRGVEWVKDKYEQRGWTKEKYRDE
jgi:hypothetical protein